MLSGAGRQESCLFLHREAVLCKRAPTLKGLNATLPLTLSRNGATLEVLFSFLHFQTSDFTDHPSEKLEMIIESSTRKSADGV